MIDRSLRRLVEVTANPTLLLNPAGIIRYANRAGLAYFGQRSPEVLGRNLGDLLAAPPREWQQRLDEITAMGQSRTWEFCDESVTASPKRLIDLIPWPDSVGQTRWILMIVETTSELRIAEEDRGQPSDLPASRREEFRSRFISMASHEFRTPLSVIYSSAELLEHFGAQWPIEKQRKHLKRIQAHVRNMINLLDDAMMIDQIDSGNITFSPMPIDVMQICRKLVDEVQRGEGAEHKMTLNFQGDGAVQKADEQWLRHILLNLLTNAVKYSPPASSVSVDVTCRDGQIILIVQDEGLGIPAADVPHVFERFHRANNVGSIPGTGLGLAIVKYAVDLHGGAVEIESQMQRGTTVRVVLRASGY